MLKVNEIFYSIQGEGQHIGTPVVFIRLAGCNLKCPWCDTNTDKYEQMTDSQIYQKAGSFKCDKVVITGGEPTVQNLAPLVVMLRDKMYDVHLETNGTLPLEVEFDWISVSPKTLSCVNSTVREADEIKFLCGFPGWKEFIFEFLRKFELDANLLKKFWVMPVDGIEGSVKEAYTFCLTHPRFSLCLQTHKLIGVK